MDLPCISISAGKVSAYAHRVDKRPDNHGHGIFPKRMTDRLRDDHHSHPKLEASPKRMTDRQPGINQCLSPGSYPKLVTNTTKLVTKIAPRWYSDMLQLQEKKVHTWAAGDQPFQMEKEQVVSWAVGDHPLLTSVIVSDADESSPNWDPEPHHLHPLELVLK